MVWYKINRLQWNIKKLKKIIIKAKKLKISRAIKLAVQGVKAKLKISVKENI